MNHVVRVVVVSSCALVLGIVAMLGGCSAPEDFLQDACKPDGFNPDPWCRKASDAGTDADSEGGAESDASNLKDDNGPGLDTSSWVPNTCKTGRCVPIPHGDEAGLWEKEPISLWIGPVDQLPAKCPDDPEMGVPVKQFSRFDKLVAPPATCSACECAPSEGTCSGVPDTLELRAGTCAQSGVVTVPFDAPANWDGSCTNANTIAAGATCPAGSQTLCTQSVHSSALPAPADEACKPLLGVPSSTIKTSWEIGALACYGNTLPQSCGIDANCINNAGPAWLQCTYRQGVHEQCPDNYQHARHVLYPKEPLDDRGCSACECGTPSGSVCVAGLRLSSDGSCGAELVTPQIGSTGAICYDFLVSGMAINSKAIVSRAYLPGVCAASGGEALGGAVPDEKNAVTFCCWADVMKPPH